MEWTRVSFTIPRADWLREPTNGYSWRAVCGLVWDIWGIALAAESTARKGPDWSVVHLPTGLGVGSFLTFEAGAAYVERILPLAPWDAIGGPLAIGPALRSQIQQVRTELGGV